MHEEFIAIAYVHTSASHTLLIVWLHVPPSTPQQQSQ